MKSAAAGATLTMLKKPAMSIPANPIDNKAVGITDVNSNFEREDLIRPFGFKGGYMSEIWQSVAMMKSSSGTEKAGLCTQSVLWSDAAIFSSHSEAAGNAIMFNISERALQLCKGKKFASPVELLDEILEEVYDYGKTITGRQDLRKTFALNALVGLDNAAWLLYAAENGIDNFDALIPDVYRPALSHHNKQVASIPLMAYSVPISELEEAVACRLAPFPGLGLGLLETNGHQNYLHWDRMVSYHPYTDAGWRQTKSGVFNLDKDYYEKSGGIFAPSAHYQDMLRF